MRLIAAFALVMALFGAPSASFAQTAPAQPAPAQAPIGLDPEAVRQWIASLGGEVEPLARMGSEAAFIVRDGERVWIVGFHECAGAVCGAAQFSAIFTSPTLSLERINAWNRERRFLKAYYDTAEDGTVEGVVQMDVILYTGPVDQLAEPLVLWLANLEQFAGHVAQ